MGSRRRRLFERSDKRSPESILLTGPFAIDLSGWQEQERSPGWALWSNEAGEILSIAVTDSDGLPTLSDEEGLRDFGRAIAESRDGGIVSVVAFPESSTPMLELIYKRQYGSGYVYTGMLFVPLADATYVLTLVCGERGTTGIREAVVSAKLAEEGRLEIEEFEHPDEGGATGRVRGWFQDPFDPNYPGLTLRSIPDDGAYDALFPDHPLSRMRMTLSKLRQRVGARRRTELPG